MRVCRLTSSSPVDAVRTNSLQSHVCVCVRVFVCLSVCLPACLRLCLRALAATASVATTILCPLARSTISPRHPPILAVSAVSLVFQQSTLFLFAAAAPPPPPPPTPLLNTTTAAAENPDRFPMKEDTNCKQNPCLDSRRPAAPSCSGWRAFRAKEGG